MPALWRPVAVPLRREPNEFSDGMRDRGLSAGDVMNWKLPDPREGYLALGELGLVTMVVVLALGPLFGALFVVILVAAGVHVMNNE